MIIRGQFVGEGTVEPFDALRAPLPNCRLIGRPAGGAGRGLQGIWVCPDGPVPAGYTLLNPVAAEQAQGLVVLDSAERIAAIDAEKNA